MRRRDSCFRRWPAARPAELLCQQCSKDLLAVPAAGTGGDASPASHPDAWVVDVALRTDGSPRAKEEVSCPAAQATPLWST